MNGTTIEANDDAQTHQVETYVMAQNRTYRLTIREGMRGEYMYTAVAESDEGEVVELDSGTVFQRFEVPSLTQIVGGAL
jgi:hypothetical protein